MPFCVLVCQTCGGHEPLIIYEEELVEVKDGRLVSKACPACRMTTNWRFAFPERRTGRDRRCGFDRRIAQ